MITEVSISNFRGIKNCTIDDISRVNLFIGKNNSGKSSILEAIYCMCKEFIQPILPDILNRRTNRSLGARELWYNYDTNPDVEISLKYNNSEVGIRISREADNVITVLNAPSQRWELRGNDYDVRFQLIQVRKKEPPPVSESEQIMSYFQNSIFIDPSFKTNIEGTENYLNGVKLVGKDVEVGRPISEIYDLGETWELLNHPDYPNQRARVVLSEQNKRLFTDNYGDGTHYALAIISSLIMRHDTGGFIEEIESHQHLGSLKKLIKYLIEYSRTKNLQLFITTHSYDVWRIFFYAYTDVPTRQKEFRSFHVVRDANTGNVDVSQEYNIQTIQEDIFEIERS